MSIILGPKTQIEQSMVGKFCPELHDAADRGLLFTSRLDDRNPPGPEQIEYRHAAADHSAASVREFRFLSEAVNGQPWPRKF